MEKIISFFDDVNKKKFKTKNGNRIYHDKEKIYNDINYNIVLYFITDKYYNNGQGIKSIIKDYNLPVTYSVLRFYMINIFNIRLRKNNEITDFLRKRRSDKAINEKKNKIGIFDETIQKNNKIKISNKRGVQGYYYNISKNKYVWLRSSWEYIYAKWLDKNNYNWDIEIKTYNLGDIIYRPDFFIFDENENIIKIIEVKGYWKDKLYKFNLLKEKITNIEIILVDKINSYTLNNLKYELKEWKNIRILNK